MESRRKELYEEGVTSRTVWKSVLQTCAHGAQKLQSETLILKRTPGIDGLEGTFCRVSDGFVFLFVVQHCDQWFGCD